MNKKFELYLCFKIQKMNAWCIRPANWAGVWNGDKELCEGKYTALFNTEEEAKQICEQLNQSYYQDQIIREAREYIKSHIQKYDIDGSIGDLNEFDVLANPKTLLEILDRNVNNE